MNKSKAKGKSASELSLKELRALVISFKVEGADNMTKKELLLEVARFEESQSRTNEDGHKILGNAGVKPAEDLGEYQGKKVIKRTERELNGKKYVDILVETGETFTDPL